MMSALFFILFFAVFGRIIGFAFRATWSVLKVLMYIIFLPIILVALVLGGLIYVALPILLIVGIVSLIRKA